MRTKKPTESMAAMAIRPETLDDLLRLADRLAESDIVPKDYQKKPGNILVAVQMGLEIGLHPIQALQSIAVINGRPSLWGDAGLGLVMAASEFHDIEETDDPGTETATCKLWRKGKADPVVRTFSQKDAEATLITIWSKEKNGYVRTKLSEKGVWAMGPAYRKRMRQMRARWWAMRDAFPGALKGIQGAEEVRDYGVPVDEAAVRPASDALMPRRIGQAAPTDGEETPPALPAAEAGGSLAETADAGGAALGPSPVPSDAEIWAAFLGEPEAGDPIETVPIAATCPKCGAEITARRLGFLHCESCHIMFEPPVQPAERETVGDPVVEGARQPLGGNQSAPHTEPGPGETFEIAGTPYRTAGITKDLLMKAFKFSEQLDQLEGKGTAMNILGTECGVESRTELTKEQGQKYIALLTKRVNQALARHGQRKQA